ncbi:MAG TPA: hypothetical protein VI248_10670 [Kineosporiaceae bacterium]
MNRTATRLSTAALALAASCLAVGAAGVPSAVAAPRATAVAAAGCEANDAHAAADAYLAALVSHDASAVPFAPDVRRVENGLVTGRSGEEIRKDLNTSIKYKIISGLHDRVYTEDPPAPDGGVSLHVNYVLDIGAPDFTLLKAKVAERFDVRCGQITFIEASISL